MVNSNILHKENAKSVGISQIVVLEIIRDVPKASTLGGGGASSCFDQHLIEF